jgi:hypothetical protein
MTESLCSQILKVAHYPRRGYRRTRRTLAEVAVVSKLA